MPLHPVKASIKSIHFASNFQSQIPAMPFKASTNAKEKKNIEKKCLKHLPYFLLIYLTAPEAYEEFLRDFVKNGAKKSNYEIRKEPPKVSP